MKEEDRRVAILRPAYLGRPDSRLARSLRCFHLMARGRIQGDENTTEDPGLAHSPLLQASSPGAAQIVASCARRISTRRLTLPAG
jgi:hypothetical protein